MRRYKPNATVTAEGIVVENKIEMDCQSHTLPSKMERACGF